MSTNNKTKQATVTAITVTPGMFAIERSDSDTDHYALSAIKSNSPRQQEMMSGAQEAYLAEQVHTMLGRNADANNMENARRSSANYSALVEEVNAVESAGQYGDYAGMVREYNIQNLTRCGRYSLEINFQVKDQMAADMKRPIEPISPPKAVVEQAPAPKKDGFFSWFFGK